MATWSESEDSSSEEEESKEVANICFMAHQDEEVTPEINEYSFNELQEAFDELMHEFKKLKVQCKILKKENNDLLNKKENVSKINEILSKEAANLKE